MSSLLDCGGPTAPACKIRRYLRRSGARGVAQRSTRPSAAMTSERANCVGAKSKIPFLRRNGVCRVYSLTSIQPSALPTQQQQQQQQPADIQCSRVRISHGKPTHVVLGNDDD